MKLELSERFFIEELFQGSMESGKIKNESITLIKSLTGDASTRRYYRVRTNSNSYVVCLDNPSLEDSMNPFVRKQIFLNENNVRVPLIYDYYPEKGYILEEDLGNITLLQYLSGVNTSEELTGLYKRAIDSLLSIHNIPNNILSESLFFTESFDYNKLIQEVDFTLTYFVEQFLGEENENTCREIRDFFSPICQRLAVEKYVLTHRDYHSRNLMINSNELIIIDFQDARMGIPQYDLASLLDDCYFQIDQLSKKELMKYYFEKLGEEKIGQNFEQFISLYDDMVLQRTFKAIGSFSYIWKSRGDQRYLKYIGFAMEKIRSVMMNSSKYKNLHRVLMRVYYEN